MRPLQNMNKDIEKVILNNIATIFDKNKAEIKENWINILYQEKFIDSEEELNYFNSAFSEIIKNFIEFIPKNDPANYLKNNRNIAATVAYNTISFPKFIHAFSFFEDSCQNIFAKNFIDKDDLVAAIAILNRLHLQVLANFSEVYFSIHNDTIKAFARLATFRDAETGGHLERTRKYAVLLAKELKLNANDIAAIDLMGPLHDIGKVGLPDRILAQFQDELSSEDFEIFKDHTTNGASVIGHVLGRQSPSYGFLKIAKDIILSHHEHYDGSGYPYGLKGTDIPLSARIFIIADVYDMKTWKKTTRSPLLHEDAVKYIKSKSGVLFDPEVVTAFLNIEANFNKIHHEFAN